MFKAVARVVVLTATIFAAGVSSAGDDVLYWMVDDTATVDEWWNRGEISIQEFFRNPPEGSAYAARIRVTGGDITEDTFLDLYLPGYGLDVGGGEYGVEFSTVGGYWGAGVPDGNQSPSGDYSEGTPEYSFIVELGNIDSYDNWTTVATSASASYSSLAAYIHETFDINPGSLNVWVPTAFTAVPEPSSGLLTLLGLAVLALRRKRLAEGV